MLHAENKEAPPRRQLVHRVKQIFRPGHFDAFMLMRSSAAK